MKSLSLLGAATACAFVLVGCGGGGGGTATVTYNGGTTLPLISNSIALTYTLTNVTQSVNGGTAVALPNSIGSVFISQGAQYAEIQTIDNITTTPATSITRSFLMTQDSTSHALTFAGILNGSTPVLATPAASYLPGTLTSTSSSVSSTLGSGGTSSITYSIGTPTSVTIGLGTFNNVYPVTATYVINGTTYTGTYYYDANLLGFVKASETITQTDGQGHSTVTSFNSELSAFNGATP